VVYVLLLKKDKQRREEKRREAMRAKIDRNRER